MLRRFGDHGSVSPSRISTQPRRRRCVRAKPDAEGLVLMNHGLITWGETAQEAYERHIALVTKAEEFLACGGSRVSSGSRAAASTAALHDLAPTSAARSARSVPSSSNSTAATRCSRFLARDDREAHHADRRRRRPIICSTRNAFRCFSKRRRRRERAAASTSSATRRTTTNYPSEFAMLDPHPRVVLVPGVGHVDGGKRRARGADRARHLPPHDAHHRSRRRRGRLRDAER